MILFESKAFALAVGAVSLGRILPELTRDAGREPAASDAYPSGSSLLSVAAVHSLLEENGLLLEQADVGEDLEVLR